jgi:hypothetical protein
MAMKQEANTPLILTIGAVSSLLVLVVMFGVEAWFRHEEFTEREDQWDTIPNSWLADIRDPQLARLETEGMDAKTGSHKVNIETAMQAVIANGGKLPTTQPTTAPSASAQ